MRDFPNNAYNQNMLRKFPGNNMDPNYGMYPGMEMYNMNMNMGMGMPNMGMGMPNMNIMNPNQPISMEMVKNLDSNSKREFYGERLFNKISNSPQFENCKDLFSKIVGIFLDLEESVIERLINDDGYFDLQVRETLRLLAERNSS